MADFSVKSAIFGRPGPELGAAASTALARIGSEMAELLMNSAIPSEGPMRTSWPALRNPCCANDQEVLDLLWKQVTGDVI